MEDRNKYGGQYAPQLDHQQNNGNLHSAGSTEARSGQSQAVFNPNFIANRAKGVVANR